MSVMGLFQGEGSLVKREKRRDGKRGEREITEVAHAHTHLCMYTYHVRWHTYIAGTTSSSLGKTQAVPGRELIPAAWTCLVAPPG